MQLDKDIALERFQSLQAVGLQYLLKVYQRHDTMWLHRAPVNVNLYSNANFIGFYSTRGMKYFTLWSIFDVFCLHNSILLDIE